LFRDSSLYPKRLSLFCLISASADRVGFITIFSSKAELLHELKKSGCQHRSIQAFDNVSAGKVKTKSLLDLYTKTYESSLAYFIHIQDSILQTGVCSSQSSRARLRVFDNTLAQPHFLVLNCADAMMVMSLF